LVVSDDTNAVFPINVLPNKLEVIRVEIVMLDRIAVLPAVLETDNDVRFNVDPVNVENAELDTKIEDKLILRICMVLPIKLEKEIVENAVVDKARVLNVYDGVNNELTFIVLP
jgi:hypothetical protein